MDKCDDDAADIVRFSLAPGSPSLGIGAGSAEIFEVAGPGAVPSVLMTSASLGRLFTDDLDAIAVPEPDADLALITGGLGSWSLTRRRRSGPPPNTRRAA